MSTWLQLRKAALGMLDQDPLLEGDVVDLLDYWLWETHRKLVLKKRPRKLMGDAAIQITEADGDTFSIDTDFGITDFTKEASLTVNEDLLNAGEPREWKYFSYQAWVGNNSIWHGDLNKPRAWTLSPADEIIISSTPFDVQEWEVRFYYFKEPAAFDANAEPEISRDYHNLIATGAALQFPHFFQGERTVTFATLKQSYEVGVREMLQERTPASKDLQFNVRSNRGRQARI